MAAGGGLQDAVFNHDVASNDHGVNARPGFTIDELSERAVEGPVAGRIEIDENQIRRVARANCANPA